MCQGLVLVYSCRHRQVGDVHLCDAARRSASNASCMASFTYMLTGKEPKRNCGNVKTSRRYLIEPCLACHLRSGLHGEATLTPAQAYASLGNPSPSSSSSSTSAVRQVSPPAETGSFRSDPSKYITRPYVGDLMSTSTVAATSVAVAVAMPKSVVVASSRGRGRSTNRPRHSSAHAGPSSVARPQSRGRTTATSSSSSSSGRPDYNSSRSRSTSRGRATAAISAHNLPGSRKSRHRSQSAARRFATSDRLSTVVEDSIPMVPMIPQGLASGRSVGNFVGSSSSSSTRLAPPPPVRQSEGPSRATIAASSSSSSSISHSSRSKGKGKELVRDTPKLSTAKGKVVAHSNSGPSPSSASRAPKPRSPKTGSSSPPPPPPPPKTGSPTRTISNRLRASKKVAKSEESLVCADAARIEGKGNFI